MAKSRHEAKIDQLCATYGWFKTGIFQHMRETLDDFDPEMTSGKVRLPDCWAFDGSDYLWIEVVDTHRVSKSKMKYLYSLRDYLEGVEVKANGAFSGLKCILYDIEYMIEREFDPFDLAYA